METKHYLFVGGVANGKWIKLLDPPQPIIRIPTPVELNVEAFLEGKVVPTMEEKSHYHTYQQHRLCGSSKTFIIFIESSLNRDDLFSKLINNYVAE